MQRSNLPALPLVLVTFLQLLILIPAFPQDVNYDESKAGSGPFPDVLKSDNGKAVTRAKEWEQQRRKDLINKFSSEVYGRIPGRPPGLIYQIVEGPSKVFNGQAVRKQVRISFGSGQNAPAMNVLLYYPPDKTGIPFIIGLNFKGNHSISSDPAIVITDEYKRINPADTALQRGIQTERWPVETFIKRGYGIATAFYGDLEPDHPEGYKTGIRSTLAGTLNIQPEEWGALAAWGWGLSRIVDYLETERTFDAKKIMVVGHSRIGKATLWAGANDTRFSIVVSNNSGEGGAALARRNFGETIRILNTNFPHWFVQNYRKYNDNAAALPVDQHMLLALVAPRPLYVASASEDLWADPYGEFLSARLAGRVYELYGKKGIPEAGPPPADTSTGDFVGYHKRTGKHNILNSDWLKYLDFADRHWSVRED